MTMDHGAEVSDYLRALAMPRSDPWAPNLPRKVDLFDGPCGPMPVLVADGEQELAWVACLERFYVDVVGHALRRQAPTPKRRWLLRGLPVVRGLFRAGELSRAAYPGHFLFATSPVRDDWASHLGALTRALCQRHRDSFVILRSVNDREHPRLLSELARAGYFVLPYRSIYLAERDALSLRHGHNAGDARIRRRTGYRVLEDRAALDPGRVAELYRQVYLERYRHTHHPAFGRAFFELALSCRDFEVVGFARDGRLDAFAILLRDGETMHVPCLGHDLGLSAREGLYRMVFHEVMVRAHERGLRVHWSGGVGDFKLRRGCVAAQEYVAIFGAHLSRRRRAVLAVLDRGLRGVGR